MHFIFVENLQAIFEAEGWFLVELADKVITFARGKERVFAFGVLLVQGRSCIAQSHVLEDVARWDQELAARLAVMFDDLDTRNLPSP